MLRIEINYQSCLKTGQCYYLHGEAFRQKDDDFPEATEQQFPEAMREALEDAADLCPTQSIKIVED
jgi:ferredoxin